MDVIGIYLRDERWAAAHLRSSFFGIKTVRRFMLDQATKEERAQAVFSYIAQKSIKAPKISLALPRSAYLVKTVEIPAPSKEAAQGVVRFEMDRFFPFSPEEVCFSSSAAARSGNTYTICAAAAEKALIDAELEAFRGAGLDVCNITVEQAALFGGLKSLSNAERLEDAMLVTLRPTELTIDKLKDGCPVYSKSTRGFALSESQGLDNVVRELRMVPGRKSQNILAVSEEPAMAERLASITGGGAADIKGMSVDSLIAAGAALALLEDSDLKVNLAPFSEREKWPLTLKLAALAASLLVAIGASYIARDILTLKRLESALESSRASRENVSNGLSPASGSKVLVKLADSDTNMLAVLNELSEVLPGDTWLTSFEYNGSEAVIEGLSSSTPAVVLTLEKSNLLSEVEFDSPVTKRGGKEAFRLKCKVRPLSERREAI